MIHLPKLLIAEIAEMRRLQRDAYRESDATKIRRERLEKTIDTHLETILSGPIPDDRISWIEKVYNFVRRWKKIQ